MGIGVGIFLVAVGAILAFAVEIETSGVNLDTIGVILMVVGAIGIAASLLFLGDSSYMGTRRTVVYDDRPPVRRRERIVEEDV